MEIILSIGSFTSFVFALILLNKKGKQLPDKILSSWMLVFGFNFLFVLLGIWKCAPNDFFWFGIASITFITHFPILFIYAKTLTDQSASLKRKYLLFVVFLVLIVFSGLILFFKLNKTQLTTFSYSVSEFIWGKIIIASLYLLIIILFLAKTYLLIQIHKTKIKNIFSFQDKIDLIWVQRIVWAFLVLFTINLFAVIFMVSKKITVAKTDYIMYVSLVILVFYIGYWGYKQGRIFYSQNEIDIINSNILTSTHPVLKEKHYQIQKNFIQEKMETEKPYLNPELTLYDLSKTVNIPSRELSNLLNHEMHMNFYEFVNRYRVEEVKKRLETDVGKFTILAIALDCGFNSKASFNRIFKQITEFTPTEYILHKNIPL